MGDDARGQLRDEAPFRLLFEHSPDGIVLVDPYHPSGAWPIVECNQAACTMHGYSHDELLGQSHDLLNANPTPVTAADRAEYLELVRREGPFQGEAIHRRKDGSRFPVEYSTTLLQLDGREMLLGVDRDVTERKQLEEAQAREGQRKQAEERLRFLADAGALLAASLDCETTLASLTRLAVPRLADWCSVNLLDSQGVFVRVAGRHADPSKEAVLDDLRQRYPPTVTQGSLAAEPFPTHTPTLISEITDAHLARFAHDPEQLRAYQEMGFRSAMIVPLRAAERLLGMIILMTGASERRYTAEDLALAEDVANRAALAIDNARLYQEAQNAIDLRDEFLSAAAHELKTPVTLVLGYAQILQRRAPAADTRARRALDVLNVQSERLATLVATLLNVSRIQLGQFSLDRQPVDVCALIRRAVDETQPTLEHHTVSCVCPEGPLIVDGDAARLEQVVQNLLQNAIKYSPAGGSITVTVSQVGEYAQVTVTDPGIGIPRAAQMHLFERFYRAPNVAGTNISGMGIGLYIVGEIVSRHGGTVEVDSAEGKGSSFTICLPYSGAASRS